MASGELKPDVKSVEREAIGGRRRSLRRDNISWTPNEDEDNHQKWRPLLGRRDFGAYESAGLPDSRVAAGRKVIKLREHSMAL